MISYVYTVQHIYALYSVQVVRANGTPFSQGPTLADDTTRTRAITQGPTFKGLADVPMTPLVPVL